MKLTDKFRFGKYGPKSPDGAKTLKEVLEIEDGREWLHWYVAQPCLDTKYEHRDRLEKESIKRHLKRKENPVPETADVGGTIALMDQMMEANKKLDKILNIIKANLGDVEHTEEEKQLSSSDLPGWDQ